MYFLLLDKSEAVFEVIIPLVIAVSCTVIYTKFGLVAKALIHLSAIMPSIASILIGFTVMLITILLTSGSESVKKLKDRKSKRQLFGNRISLFQLLHIQFCYLLIVEVFLLLYILAYLFLSGIGVPRLIQNISLVVICFLTTSILLCIVRSISNLHFGFFNSEL